jgi:uncharacterized membrane protein
MTTKVEKTVLVDAPVSTAYNQWTQFEDFPPFHGWRGAGQPAW